jgi:hypothetical protein
MTVRLRKGSSVPGLLGGLTMFAIEALIVASLGLVAGLVSIVVLALQ